MLDSVCASCECWSGWNLTHLPFFPHVAPFLGGIFVCPRFLSVSCILSRFLEIIPILQTRPHCRTPHRDGYGGVVVYTRDAQLPESLLPRLRTAANKVQFDFDRDFSVTDNSCPSELSEGQKLLLREQFAGKVALQTEQQLQAEATRLRGTAVNSVKAQKLFFANQLGAAEKAFAELSDKAVQFEKEIVSGKVSSSSAAPEDEQQ